MFSFKEKFCFFSEKKRNGNLIWFHGASVGEVKSIVPLIEKLESIDNFNSEQVENEFKEFLSQNNLGMGQLLPAFRLALTGIGMGPSLFNIAEIIGKNETIKRLEFAIKNIK